MSRIIVISNPADCSDRTAASRPAPGPLIKTSTRRNPRSYASFAAASAETCAANGVFFREPLKPLRPADDHAMTLPYVSVSVTSTLLNVALMYAFPLVSTWTFFFFFVTGADCCFAKTQSPFERSLRTRGCEPRVSSYFFSTAFFFPATVFLFPLRVRALVRVR